MEGSLRVLSHGNYSEKSVNYSSSFSLNESEYEFAGYIPTTTNPGDRFFCSLTLAYMLVVLMMLGPVVYFGRKMKKYTKCKKMKAQNRKWFKNLPPEQKIEAVAFGYKLTGSDLKENTLIKHDQNEEILNEEDDLTIGDDETKSMKTSYVKTQEKRSFFWKSLLVLGKSMKVSVMNRRKTASDGLLKNKNIPNSIKNKNIQAGSEKPSSGYLVSELEKENNIIDYIPIYDKNASLVGIKSFNNSRFKYSSNNYNDESIATVDSSEICTDSSKDAFTNVREFIMNAVDETDEHATISIQNDQPQKLSVYEVFSLTTNALMRKRNKIKCRQGARRKCFKPELESDREAEEELDYTEFDWDDLPPKVKNAIDILGVGIMTWNMDEVKINWWQNLTSSQKKSAMIHGYNEQSWDSMNEINNKDKHITRDWETVMRVISWDKESEKLMRLAIPGSIDAIANSLFYSTKIALLVGNLDSQAYVAYAMIHAFLGLIDCFYSGIEEAEEILTAQAIGMGNYFLAGQYVQQTTIIYSFVAIPTYIAWACFSGSILLMLGFDKETAELAAAYAPIAIIGEFITGITGNLSALMWSAEKGTAMTIFDTFYKAINVGALALLIPFIDNNLVDIGYLDIFTNFMHLVHLYLYIKKKGWIEPFKKGLFEKLSLKNNVFQGVLQICVPLSIGSFLALGEWELLTLFAALMGPAEVITWSITGVIWGVFENVPSGMSTAAGIRIAAHLGSGRPGLAKISAYKSLFYSVMIASCVTLVFFSHRDTFIRYFTNDPTLQDMLESLVWLLGVGNVFMVIGSDAYGIVSTQLRAKLATSVYFVCLWCIAIPLSAYFTFVRNYNLESILFSTVAGYVTASFCLLFFVFTSNWSKISIQIIKKADEVC